jgi:hypothetical protein
MKRLDFSNFAVASEFFSHHNPGQVMSHDRKHWCAWIALFLAVLGIVFFRAPEVALSPTLLWDEGSKVFAHFYEQREPAQILRFKSGYLPLIGNLIGYAAVRFPTRVIPYAFVGSALLITSITYCLFFARAFRRWFPSDLDRALMCLVFALAPISSSQLVAMSDYSLWNLLATLILLIVWRPSEKKGWRFAHGLACNLLVWSHPLTIIIAPVVLWRAFKDEENRTFYRLLLFNLLVHQIFGVSGVVTTHGLWDHSTGVPIPVSFATKFLDSCVWTVQIVAATAFRTAFGSLFFESVVRETPALLAAWMVFLVIACYAVARKVPRTRLLLAFLAYLIVSLSFLSCFLRYEDVHNDPIGFVSDAPRYIYLQSLCFLLLFGTLLTTGWGLVRPRGQYLVQKYNRLASLPLAALVCHYYLLNTQLGHYLVWNTQHASPYNDPDPQNGVIVREFFSKLAEAEETRGSRRDIRLTAEKIKDWPITIDTTASHAPMNFRLSHRARLLVAALALFALVYLTRRFWTAWLSRRYRQPGQT